MSAQLRQQRLGLPQNSSGLTGNLAFASHENMSGQLMQNAMSAPSGAGTLT